MANLWRDDECFKLIALWGEENVQAQLEGCRRNKHVYENISKEMSDAGYSKSAVQCRDKVKKLKQEYKKVKDKNNPTGTGRTDWKFYDKVNEILGNKPATKPPVLIDTSSGIKENDDDDQVGLSEADIDNSSFLTSDVSEDGAEGDHSSSSVNESAQSVEGLEEKVDDVLIIEEKNSGDKKTGKKSMIKKPKKRPTKEDKFEKAINSVVEKVVKYNKESDERFIELEEKRMKMDERMMELEDRRWKEEQEREAQRRREEREFQLRLFAMCNPNGMPFFNSPNYFNSFDSQWGNNDNVQ